VRDRYFSTQNAGTGFAGEGATNLHDGDQVVDSAVGQGQKLRRERLVVSFADGERAVGLAARVAGYGSVLRSGHRCGDGEDGAHDQDAHHQRTMGASSI
jgi:hypothetical protein